MATSQLEEARVRLLARFEEHESTRGLYVHPRGRSLIVGRREAVGPDREPEDDDRIRLTHLHGDRFGLSVMRHTGRWEKTPFSGTPDELVDVMIQTLQHLLAAWP